MRGCALRARTVAAVAGFAALARDAAPRLRGERGQAAVELVALLPLLVTVALAAGHVLAAGAARELAGHAAEAAAIAVLRGEDARAAGRASLPSWSRDRIDVRVRGRAVRVRVEPLAVVPGVAELLTATATAHAGPEASP
jgi:pilus assembly protein CpaE